MYALPLPHTQDLGGLNESAAGRHARRDTRGLFARRAPRQGLKGTELPRSARKRAWAIGQRQYAWQAWATGASGDAASPGSGGHLPAGLTHIRPGVSSFRGAFPTRLSAAFPKSQHFDHSSQACFHRPLPLPQICPTTPHPVLALRSERRQCRAGLLNAHRNVVPLSTVRWRTTQPTIPA